MATGVSCSAILFSCCLEKPERRDGRRCAATNSIGADRDATGGRVSGARFVGVVQGFVALPALAYGGGGEIPIGAALAHDVAQVLPEVGGGGTAPEPVAVVDLVDNEARLQDDGVGDHGVVVRVGVFLDVEVFLNLA